MSDLKVFCFLEIASLWYFSLSAMRDLLLPQFLGEEGEIPFRPINCHNKIPLIKASRVKNKLRNSSCVLNFKQE